MMRHGVSVRLPSVPIIPAPALGAARLGLYKTLGNFIPAVPLQSLRPCCGTGLAHERQLRPYPPCPLKARHGLVGTSHWVIFSPPCRYNGSQSRSGTALPPQEFSPLFTLYRRRFLGNRSAGSAAHFRASAPPIPGGPGGACPPANPPVRLPAPVCNPPRRCGCGNG